MHSAPRVGRFGPKLEYPIFRVDLGVVHPDYAGTYLAGIECDGARYHSSATARDRDKVRQAVLEGLGWTILRVWSTDWFQHPLDVADRLHDKLEQLLEADREVRATVEDEADEQTTEAELPGESGDEEEIAQRAPSEPGHDQVPKEEEAAADAQEELPLKTADFDEVPGAVMSTDSEASGGNGAMPIAAAPSPRQGLVQSRVPLPPERSPARIRKTSPLIPIDSSIPTTHRFCVDSSTASSSARDRSRRRDSRAV